MLNTAASINRKFMESSGNSNSYLVKKDNYSANPNKAQNQLSFKAAIPAAPPKEAIKGLGRFGKALANSLWKENGIINKIAVLSDKVPGLAESVFVLAVTTTLRPATVMITPGIDKEDKKYAAAHSMARA